MLLGVIPMICFRILGIFGEKMQKSKKEIWAHRVPTPRAKRKSGHIGFLRRSVGNPCRGVGNPRRGVALGYAMA